MTHQSQIPTPRYDSKQEIAPVLKQIAEGDTHGALESIEHLSQQGIPLQNSVGWSPDQGFRDPTLLMIASSYGNMEIIEDLLARGCDPRVCNRNGIDAYTFAAIKGHLNVLERLQSVGIDHTNAKMTGTLACPLFWAARYGQLEVVQKLEALGADIHGVTEEGTTLLNEAAESGNAKLVEWLLDKGLEINGQGLRSSEKLQLRTMTPLMKAARALEIAPNPDHVSTVRLLIQRGADVTTKDSFQRTALSCTDNEEIKTLLIEAGCPPESENETGTLAFSMHASSLSSAFPLDPLLNRINDLSSEMLDDQFRRDIQRNDKKKDV